MYGLETANGMCPYCGEQVELVIDRSVHHQEYIEDCEVCCRPISVLVEIAADGKTNLTLSDENG